MTSDIKTEQMTTAAEDGPRPQRVLRFAAVLVFLYTGIILALYTAIPDSKQYASHQDANSTPITAATSAKLCTPTATSGTTTVQTSPSTTAEKVSTFTATSGTTTVQTSPSTTPEWSSIETTSITTQSTEEKQTTKQTKTTKLFSESTFPETKANATESPPTYVTEATAITTNGTKEDETTKHRTTTEPFSKTTTSETTGSDVTKTPKTLATKSPANTTEAPANETTVQETANSTLTNSTSETTASITKSSKTHATKTATVTTRNTGETTPEFATNATVAESKTSETTKANETRTNESTTATVTRSPELTEANITGQQTNQVTETTMFTTNGTEEENTNKERTTMEPTSKPTTAETPGSNTVKPPKTRVYTPLTCLLGTHVGVPDVHLRDGLCDYVIFMHVMYNETSHDLQAIKNDLGLKNFLEDARTSVKSKYLLSVRQSDESSLKNLAEDSNNLLLKYQKDKIWGYGYATVNDVEKIWATLRAITFMSALYFNSPKKAEMIWFLGIRIIPGVSNKNESLSLFYNRSSNIRYRKIINLYIFISHIAEEATETYPGLCHVDPIGSWEGYNDKKAFSLNEYVQVALTGEFANLTVLPSMSMATIVYGVADESLPNIRSIEGVKCTSKQYKHAQDGMCLKNLTEDCVEDGNNTNAITYAVNEVAKTWVTFENYTSIQGKMRRANLEAYKIRNYGFGWAVYDVDLSDTNMACSKTRFARLESIRAQIDEALKRNVSSRIKWW